MTNKSFPLQWPLGYRRTRSPQSSRYTYRDWNGQQQPITLHKAFEKLKEQIRLMNSKDLVVSTNIKVRRRDGGFYAKFNKPTDTGVAVYFTSGYGRPTVIACDKWNRVACNVRAVALTLERMRGLDRDGCSEIGERSFVGHSALPEKAGMGDASWYALLDVPPGASAEAINRAWKKKAMKYHPDGTEPNEQLWFQYQAALEQGLARFK